jgi:hypothetical protein
MERLTDEEGLQRGEERVVLLAWTRPHDAGSSALCVKQPVHTRGCLTNGL